MSGCIAIVSLCLTILCLCAFPYVHTQVAGKLLYDPCVSRTTCHECMQTPSCAWCFSPDFNQMARCFQPSYTSLQSRLCPEEYVWNPDNILQMLVSKELSRPHAQFEGGGRMSGSNSSTSSTSSSGLSSRSSSSHWEPIDFTQSEIVQVRPQRVNLKLRARESYTLRMHYTQAEDYPVDLYYLMGLGKSMEDKDKLSKLGNLLAETISNITSNFRLGFGTIVDNLQEPCEGCATPYGFKNFMSLSRDTNQFSQMVKNASVSRNLDAPEGGFDAIVQAIVCRHEIGWREKARHILVFSTDAGFHYAGDGKLGGIITPNDGRCHLEQGLYTHSTVQDYPSIPEINLKVKQNAIHVIFAVTESQISIYKRFQEQVEGSSIGHLYNSSNIVELIKNDYEQISSTVSMKDNSTSTVKINYYSRCLNATSPERKTNKCGNIKVGDVVTFKVEIEVMSCPADPKEWLQTLQIYPVGLNESLTVNLEMLCGCACEIPGNVGYEVSSPRCNYFGTYKCGICECDSSHFGQTCECSTSEIYNLENTLGCRPGNATTLVCSGRGNCLCGHCECDVRLNEDEKIDGNYCECDNFSCERHEGNICSGPTHGTCECGVCQCKEPWGGRACDCKLSNETC